MQLSWPEAFGFRRQMKLGIGTQNRQWLIAHGVGWRKKSLEHSTFEMTRRSKEMSNEDGGQSGVRTTDSDGPRWE